MSPPSVHHFSDRPAAASRRPSWHHDSDDVTERLVIGHAIVSHRRTVPPTVIHAVRRAIMATDTAQSPQSYAKPSGRRARGLSGNHDDGDYGSAPWNGC